MRNLSRATLDLVGPPLELRLIQYGKCGGLAADNRVGWVKSALNRAKLIRLFALSPAAFSRSLTKVGVFASAPDRHSGI